MSNIVDKIKKIDNLYHVSGCTSEQLKSAEDVLRIKFPREVVEYGIEYGAISFYGTEWTGLNVEGYLTVVDSTMQERILNSLFPADCFVIENQGIDGILTVGNERGQIFSLQYENMKLLCDSLSEYLDICCQRRKNHF